MGFIFYIIGKSASGKDTIYNEIRHNKELKLLDIIPNTTRPRRKSEIDGITYNFSTAEQFEDALARGNVIEYREYKTEHGLWVYYTLNSDIDLTEHNYITIGTIESYNQVKKFYGEDSVIPIYIYVDDRTRIHRALSREDAQEIPRYKEMCRRFIADEEDFSDENIKQAGIVKRYVNDSLSKCIDNITADIKALIF